ncbi:MAG: hypothetical protein EU541_07730 [Promethearchaeota archaeon]|nr:MAG: hypothetical protein EU541_07730 [Candidatus Lokiarchaeota archaeon]
MNEDDEKARKSLIDALQKEKKTSQDITKKPKINIGSTSINNEKEVIGESSGNKITLISKIGDLRIKKHTFLQKGEYDKAKEVAERIIHIAKKGGMLSSVSDEEAEIKKIQDNIDKKKNIMILKRKFKVLKRDYEKWVSQQNIPRSHNMLQEFIEEYKDLDGFDSIREIKDLDIRDKKLWVKYRAKNR